MEYKSDSIIQGLYESRILEWEQRYIVDVYKSSKSNNDIVVLDNGKKVSLYNSAMRAWYYKKTSKQSEEASKTLKDKGFKVEDRSISLGNKSLYVDDHANRPGVNTEKSVKSYIDDFLSGTKYENDDEVKKSIIGILLHKNSKL